ncbi:MAG TPA: zinc ribbon domain-containing protein, partial [Longimicrobium sp.]|nr:zinc ribbon domain-containing protein [Longimicrobium sp.]
MAETCSACGAEASGRFCNQCGGAVSAACRECGTALPRGARFCGECGLQLAAAESGPMGGTAAAASTAADGYRSIAGAFIPDGREAGQPSHPGAAAPVSE